eukprot:CAMPEP_0202908336 /NCGR_PEP_ID=MMETSP1392-20130828/45711_1 /ASSEMBLY_ACC=CAM_ASM_000868 /TAXON_ID=225041 /ORGANISM="Chlamydomonas chlamydogama, Strain SAG 11-48b" /LENGTH=255 /DNA_ID=CAMNT_0049597617 /DNA_START=54 /DNA_END=822 /DNA_ORIENTATION=-
MRVRHRKPADRKELADIKSPTWQQAFSKYLEELECPVASKEPCSAAVLLWLLRYAVHLEYSDKADALNVSTTTTTPAAHAQAGRSAGPPSTSGSTAEAFSDFASPAVQQQLRALLELLGVKGGQHKSLLQMVQEASSLLGDRILPLVQQQQGKAQGKGGNGAAAVLEELPLGFETGDANTDTAAKLLRLLYIRDLRTLQNQVDQAIVDVQEYTSNPRTDSSLGEWGGSRPLVLCAQAMRQLSTPATGTSDGCSMH